MSDGRPEALDHAPEPLYNRPGLRSLSYRIGTFALFRGKMLRRIPDVRVEESEERTLRSWSARDSEDYGITLLEMWAYIADILTFYQERVANEAFIRTATLRESLLRLAALLDYRPAPGVAAQVDLVVTMKPGAEAKLPAGLPVQHVPVADEKPQKFETEDALLVAARWNELKPVPTPPERLEFKRGDTCTALAGTRVEVTAGDMLLFVGEPRAPSDPLETNTENYYPGSEKWELRQVTSVKPLPDRKETRITWQEGLGYFRFRNVVVEPLGELFVFRGRAALFGHNAIDWNALPAETQAKLDGTPLDVDTGTATIEDIRAARGDWDNKEANDERRIDLDAEYPEIEPGSWIVLTGPGYEAELYRVLRTETVNRSDYLLSGRVTRCHVDTDENFHQFGLGGSAAAAGEEGYEPQVFSLVRSTVVLIVSERLEVAERVPEEPPDHVTGSAIAVREAIDDLEPGRMLLVSGMSTKGSNETERAFVRAVSGNTIYLQSALTHAYVRPTVTISANVVAASHGETVSGEVLGNADAGRPFQSFTLTQKPVTYVREAGAPGGAASTLELYVNAIRWHEVRSFYGHGGDEAIFIARIAADGTHTVRLGDGSTGALPSTGRNNVTATYRKGLGTAGNVPAGTVKTPLERPKGLKGIVNPLPPAGGTEPESDAAIRGNAPNTVRTFGRIVSLRDFADAAREYTGVAKARAFLEWDNEWRAVHLVVAGENGTALGSTIIGELKADLDSRRDPNRKLTIEEYEPEDVELHVTVYHDPDYLPARIEEAVRAAVAAYFAFDRLELGRSVALSDVYRAIQSVEGVRGVRISRFTSETIPADLASRVDIDNNKLPRLDLDRDFVLTLEASGQ